MAEVEGYLVACIPLEIVQVAPFHPMFPLPEYKGMHLAGKQIGEGDTSREEREGLQK